MTLLIKVKVKKKLKLISMINGRISLKKTYQMCYICVSGLFNSGRMALFRKIMPWTMLSAKIKSIVES
jgi:hypothetical protein